MKTILYKTLEKEKTLHTIAHLTVFTPRVENVMKGPDSKYNFTHKFTFQITFNLIKENTRA